MSHAPTPSVPYSQQATYEEKASVLRNERRQATTLAQLKAVFDHAPGGRFHQPERPPDPTNLYPKLPTNSPWSGDPVSPEEPLGFSVEEVPNCGPFLYDQPTCLLRRQPSLWRLLPVSPPLQLSRLTQLASLSLVPPCQVTHRTRCLPQR
jgi:hypothetical protein